MEFVWLQFVKTYCYVMFIIPVIHFALHACMSDIIKWILVSTGGNAYSKSVYEYPLIKQTALDGKYTPQILQMSCVSTAMVHACI